MKSFLSIVAGLSLLSMAATAQMVSSHAPTMAKPEPQSNSGGISSALLQASGKPVVKVNGTVLTDRDLVHELYVIFPYSQIHNGIPKNMEPEMRRGAMDMIVFDELVYQEALRRKMTIDEATYAKAKKRFMTQFPDKRSFDQFMALECQNSPQTFRRKLTRTLLIEKLMKQEVTSKSVVTDAEVRDYYNKHPKNFEREETFSIQSISIMPPATGGPDVQKEAKKRAETALKAAKATKSYQEFGLVAEKYSEDDFRVNMGDHKAVEKGKLPPEVISAALKMKPGDVSELIALGGSYTIFRLNAHAPAGKAPFDEVKKKLHDDAAKAKLDKVRSAFNKKLHQNAKIQEL